MTDQPYELCVNGHPFTPENTRWESSGRGKNKRRRCRQCLRDRAQRRRENAEYTVTDVIPSVIREAQPRDVRIAFAEFEKAQQHVVAKCKDQSEWTDWEEDSNEHIPSPEYAEALCEGCPLLKACDRAAKRALPGGGVWGGKVYIYGEQYNGGTYDKRRS